MEIRGNNSSPVHYHSKEVRVGRTIIFISFVQTDITGIHFNANTRIIYSIADISWRGCVFQGEILS